ncbi:hypothetical protein K458DRAFT_165371 [Lentithecium fluviatile CBS 122367]|uniref:Uncharacterized protein n=1 Tax=Lentithecium fluviatile CBS 122367 TaxID=1168545 RepID=A0A6G1IGG4_9PLEO|nr:hypothetical protein K458DRAFT_165371 [Lentithecium fluviatile CBS 122367]
MLEMDLDLREESVGRGCGNAGSMLGMGMGWVGGYAGGMLWITSDEGAVASWWVGDVTSGGMVVLFNECWCRRDSPEWGICNAMRSR